MKLHFNTVALSQWCLSGIVVGHTLVIAFGELPSVLWILFLASAFVSLAICLANAISRLIWPFVFLLAGTFNAVWQFSDHQQSILHPDLERVDVEVVGNVIGLPQSNNGDTRFQFRINKVVARDESNQAGLTLLLGRRVQLNCYRCPFEVQSDDDWRFTIRLKRPRGFASPHAFDYERFLFRNKIVGRGYVRLKSPYERLERRAYGINQIRAQLKDLIIGINDSEPRDFGRALILALSIGDKSAFTQTQREVLQKSGISHLVAISGLHVGLVFGVVFALCNLLLKPFTMLYQYGARQSIALLPALLAAGMYAGLAGFAVSTQRALIMLLIFSLCRLCSRSQSLLQLLLYTGVAVLLIDPFSVLDAGFWLSFLAVFIIALSNAVINIGANSSVNTSAKKRANRNARQSLSLLRLQPLLWLGMMPLTATLFGQVSLVSPLINLVLVPLFCVLLIPATLAAVVLHYLGLHSVSLPAITGLSAMFNGLYDLLVVVISMSFAGVYIGLSWTLAAAVVLTLALIFKWQAMLWHWRAAKTLIIIALCVLSIQPQASAGLRLTILDVGQGLSMLVELPDYTLLYDTGPKYRSGFTAAQAVVVPYMRGRGIRDLNDVVISHADNDHIGGFDTVESALAIKRLFSSRQDKLPSSTACRAGHRWLVGDTVFEFLGPSNTSPSGSNNRSCVLLIEHKGQRILITGDIERQVERHMLNEGSHLQADIMLVPHQGSKTSSTEAFIDAVNPSVALVAAGYKNQYGHPHPDVMQRYARRHIKMISTIEHGTTTITFSESQMRIESFRLDHRRFWRE